MFPAQDEELTDLDEIERELKMLDEQILKMAESNNINAEAVLASTETAVSAGDGRLLKAASGRPVVKINHNSNKNKIASPYEF